MTDLAIKNFLPVCRDIQSHWVWDDKPYSRGQAWIDLLLLANYKDMNKVIDGKVVPCRRGDVDLSIAFLANKWGWDRKKVKRFLGLLEASAMVTTKTTTHRTTITIENYSKYNGEWTTDAAVNDSLNDPLRDPHNKNIKKNNIIGGKPKNQIPPTLDMVKAYCKERHNGIDAENFIDHYEARGWMIGKNKMKDWQAAIRTWEKRNPPDPARKRDEDLRY